MRSIYEEAAKVFDERVKKLIAKASECDLVGDPPRPPFVLAVTDEIGQDKVSWREVNILEEMDYAVELGVMSTPAIAINGELTFVTLPAASKLRIELLKRLP